MFYYAANKLDEKKLEEEFLNAKKQFLNYIIKANIIDPSDKIKVIESFFFNISEICLQEVANNETFFMCFVHQAYNSIIVNNKIFNKYSEIERMFAFWHEFIHVLQEEKNLDGSYKCFSSFSNNKALWAAEMGATIGSEIMACEYCKENLNGEGYTKIINQKNIPNIINLYHNYENIEKSYNICGAYPHLQSLCLLLCKALKISPQTFVNATIFPASKKDVIIKNLIEKVGINCNIFNETASRICSFDMHKSSYKSMNEFYNDYIKLYNDIQKIEKFYSKNDENSNETLIK